MPFINFPFFSVSLPSDRSYKDIPFINDQPSSKEIYEINPLPYEFFSHTIPFFTADYQENEIVFNSNFIKGHIRNKIISITNTDSMPDFWANIRTALGTLTPFYPFVFLHASAGLLENDLFVFSGVSGTGKSTSQDLLQTTVINEDGCLIDTSRSELLLNPFEAHSFFNPSSDKIEKYCLKRIFFLNRKDKNCIKKISCKAEIITKLLENITVFSKNKFYMEKLLDRIEEFSDNKINFYHLSYCKKGFKEWFLNEIYN
ncbi:hypothetical protein KAJ27_03770 [bacterium]|nr:hypothetical protein [bacterium]